MADIVGVHVVFVMEKFTEQCDLAAPRRNIDRMVTNMREFHCSVRTLAIVAVVFIVSVIPCSNRMCTSCVCSQEMRKASVTLTVLLIKANRLILYQPIQNADKLSLSTLQT